MNDRPDQLAARLLTVIVCAAGPAAHVGRLVELAQQRGWQVQIVTTPTARTFVDVDALEAQTGRSVRSEYRQPGEPRSNGRTDAIIVAPATYNTINKMAHGIADNYALGLLAEAPGLGIPVIVLPFVNEALAANPAYQRSSEVLIGNGIVMLGEKQGNRPHQPGSGGNALNGFPWCTAINSIGIGRPDRH